MDNDLHLEDFTLLPKFQFASQYLPDYFGIWSIHEPLFRAMADHCNGMNLSSHMQSTEVKQSVESRDNRLFQLTDDGIAVIQVRGAMMKSVPSMGDGTSTVRLRQQIRAARRDSEVLGAMLVMDTPGGTVKGNADFVADVAEFAKAKPIYAFVEDMCASAGVSVASQATKRFANTEKAIYGSMGTYGVLVDYSGQAEKLGIKVHVVKAGDFKGMGEPGSAISDEQVAEVQRIINGMNESYLQMIAQGLGKPIETIRPLADGRVLFAADAASVGLINGVQTYEQTYAELVQVCQSKKPVVSSKPRSQIMADTQAATLAELKSKFPKSTADWREKQLEANATLVDAAVNYAAFADEQREKDRQSHEKQLADAKAKAESDVEAAKAEAKSKSGSLGHNPIRSAGNDSGQTEYVESGDAIEDFNIAVEKAAGPNADLTKRQRAIRQVASQKPDLYQAYLLACNPGKRQKRLISEKLEAVGSN
ncbi:S49 family peptidase [Anatilimnocola sp. NA78]|uniref:S49 family peptidase n=1 Tax=Anatilimnocola sp. NA78 TaxID=3415683 RepID=UPI003CE4B8B7